MEFANWDMRRTVTILGRQVQLGYCNRNDDGVVDVDSGNAWMDLGIARLLAKFREEDAMAMQDQRGGK